MSPVVLVTGVSRTLGARFCRMIADDPHVGRVVGVDVVPPAEDLGRARFLRVDIRTPLIGRVLAEERVDTVVHMSVLATPARAGGRMTMKETNVIGTMQLLAACQKTPELRKLVVKSSAAVYGSSPRDPAMFTEETEPGELPHSGFAKDSTEVEGYVRGFARRRPDVAVTVLRFANFLGPRLRTPLAEYFALPVLPTPLGFDARLQFVHEHDGLEALRVATVHDHAGTFNVAGDGVITLTQAARRAGRPTVPVPTSLVGWVGHAFRRAGLSDFSPEQMEFLTHGRVLDCSRMRSQLRFEPKYPTTEAFDDFLHGEGSPMSSGVLAPERVQVAEAALRSILLGDPDDRTTGARPHA